MLSGEQLSTGVLETLSLQGNILNNASLVFDQATTGTYAGALMCIFYKTKQQESDYLRSRPTSQGR
jgi:hypothetical protein